MMKDFLYSPQIIDYATEISRGEFLVLQALREETLHLPEAMMMVTPLQGHFLEFLVRWGKARRILEIGTFTGYSALSMALALPLEGKIVTLDKHEEWTQIAQRYWVKAGVSHKIQLQLGLAHKTLETLEGSFDMIFIDADKQRYSVYYEMCLKLLRSGGLIVFDNTLWEGTVVDFDNEEDTPKALRSFNAALRDDERVDTFLLPLADGMTLAVKR
jgi:O-methyltransferase